MDFVGSTGDDDVGVCDAAGGAAGGGGGVAATLDMLDALTDPSAEANRFQMTRTSILGAGGIFEHVYDFFVRQLPSDVITGPAAARVPYVVGLRPSFLELC